MSDDISMEDLTKSMKKAKDEFEIAAGLIATALTGVHERLERIERWITESDKGMISQKNQED